jgi:hypothetical protein
VNAGELKTTLDLHAKWLMGENGGKRADLRGADLRGADLRDANLRGADLYGADLRDANLYGANLRDADLYGAYLYGANLRDANLRGADLYGADLRGADLRDANLRGANLYGANLYGAKGVNKYRTTNLYMLADQVGKIRAYKLVKPNGEGPYNGGIVYEVGKSYEVEDASTDEDDQCAAGISLADLPWCIQQWREGYRILLCEFTAKDIAAIPVASDGKFRVHRMKVVKELDISVYGLGV